MKFRVQVVIESETGNDVEEIGCLERNEARLEEVGLTMAEAKKILVGIQKAVVEQQTADYLARQEHCPHCGQARRHKGEHRMMFRTLFGNLTLKSPRFFHCKCQPQATLTFSPLTGLLNENTAPERLYLETKWASLLSFGMTTALLADVLPLDEKINAASVRNHLQKVATRSEAGLGDERFSFIDGCPRDFAALPRPAAPLTVGIDGGYIRRWDDKKTHFEAIVGKSKPEEGEAKCFGFVQTYDQKPKRRLFELLKSQGMQMNQQVIFFSDGGDDVRDLQWYLNPEAEHYLDWFHITMRLTVLGQHAKGLSEKDEKLSAEALKILERIKHFLWHGNVVEGLDVIEDLEELLYGEEVDEAFVKKMVKAVGEFRGYIEANERFITNYGERWRNDEIIATAFVESTVNAVVSKRFVKKQQMQWTLRGAHLLMQTRTKVFNGELEKTFREWYPGFRVTDVDAVEKAA